MEIRLFREHIDSFEFLNSSAIKLKLNECGLTEIPDLDEYNFKEIDLERNDLQKIPKFPSCIEVLNLSWNKLIGKIDLSGYKSLRVLRIHDNKLQIFPKLPNNIKEVDIRFNYFKTIRYLPDNIEKLLLSYNPNLESFQCPKNIKTLWTYNCPKLTDVKVPKNISLNGVRNIEKPKEVIFKKTKENECLISYEPFNENSEYLMCEKCNVEYLYSAIMTWLSENDECPHCRQDWCFNDFLYINHG